jgi:IS30 family transposase
MQRYEIEAVLKAGIKKKGIANEIRMHPSTISRELSRYIAQREKTAGKYLAANSQRKTDKKHFTKPKVIKIFIK